MLPQGGRVGDARSGKVGELEVVVLRRVRCLFNGSWRVRVVRSGRFGGIFPGEIWECLSQDIAKHRPSILPEQTPSTHLPLQR